MFFHTLPNYLTLCRIVMIPLIIVGLYYNTNISIFVSFTLYTVACITDFIDGYIARVYQQTSVLGRFLDPIADKLLVTLLLITSIATGQIDGLSCIAVLIIVAREVFISGLREFVADYKMHIKVNSLGRIKTALQMFSLGFIILAPISPGSWKILNIGILLLWGAALLTSISAFVYTHKTLKKLFKTSQSF
jgi:cardiolipin synthase (CMP-forming)